MNNEKHTNDFLIEVSWEVCNMVGGIYTVLSTKAHTLVEQYADRYILIGPDLWGEKDSKLFEEQSEVLPEWRAKARLEGLRVRTGTWKVPGSPRVILVNFEDYYEQKNALYGRMWEHYGVDSLHGYGDYDESCMFAYASSLVIESLYRFYHHLGGSFTAHFHEWTTGMGLLNTKLMEPAIATVFTTHATSIGRSIAGNHLPLYDNLKNYQADQMAEQLNIQSKHSIEKRTAMQADSFTTVSSITARECAALLGRKPWVTPNGFEERVIPPHDRFSLLRMRARSAMLNLAEKLVGYSPSSDAFLVATAGRYEYKNKGYDLFLDTLKELKSRSLDREIIAFFFVPAWVGAPREELLKRYLNQIPMHERLTEPFITHHLHNYHDDPIVQKIHELGFKNETFDKVKVIYVPCYLNGSDGFLNMSYYDTLIGLDASVFASYYEPWGYTPHESMAFSVPTITTTLAGFGQWVLEQGVGEQIADPVRVIDRTDSNYHEVVLKIADQLQQIKRLSPIDFQHLRDKAQRLAQQTLWEYFISSYDEAYEYAGKERAKRMRNIVNN